MAYNSATTGDSAAASGLVGGASCARGSAPPPVVVGLLRQLQSTAPKAGASPRRFALSPLDWYAAHLLAVSLGILLLSATDAFLTAVLLLHGADEVNPLMAVLVYHSVAVFAALKMAMTGASIVLMVFLARYRFMRVIRVELVLYAVLLVYVSLIGYETWMLNASGTCPSCNFPDAVTFPIAPPSAKLALVLEPAHSIILIYLRFLPSVRS